MKEKTLAEFPEFVKVNGTVQKLRAEKAEVWARLEQIEFELSQSKQTQVDGRQAWDTALEEGTVRRLYATDNQTELKDELSQLEGRLRFLNEALSVGEMELDKARGQASLAICESIRPEWVAEVRRILQALKTISESNERLDVMRATLEADGVVSGGLPYSKYDIGGSWSDRYGGRLVGFQRECTEHFPELEAAAGMAIKSKLAALAKREEEFERREQLDESL